MGCRNKWVSGTITTFSNVTLYGWVRCDSGHLAFIHTENCVSLAPMEKGDRVEGYLGVRYTTLLRLEVARPELFWWHKI